MKGIHVLTTNKLSTNIVTSKLFEVHTYMPTWCSY